MRLEEWRQSREAGEELALPSGLVMRLRRVGILDLAEQGAIPAPLLGMVQTLVSKGRASVDLAEFQEYARLINVVVKAAAIEPQVADEGSREVLGIAELPMADRVAIFNWANPTQAPALRPFPAE